MRVQAHFRIKSLQTTVRDSLKKNSRCCALKLKRKHPRPKPGCVVCGKTCIDDYVPKMICTRSVTKLFNDFIILEAYRCMPLLGDEEDIPNWDVHIVRFSIVFVKRNTA